MFLLDRNKGKLSLLERQQEHSSINHTNMRVIKPNWVIHPDDKGNPQTIFSAHVHPDGTRLATGTIQNMVKFWSTAPILDPAKEEAADRLLCTMEGHDGKSLIISLVTTTTMANNTLPLFFQGPSFVLDGPSVGPSSLRAVMTPSSWSGFGSSSLSLLNLSCHLLNAFLL